MTAGPKEIMLEVTIKLSVHADGKFSSFAMRGRLLRRAKQARHWIPGIKRN